MNITTEKIQEKILKYHQLVREGKDTTSIQAEIVAYTEQYTQSVKDECHAIAQEHKMIAQQRKVSKKDYNRLIDLYRQARELMNDISKFKKSIRESMK